MNILGISGQERDAAAALVQDGRVVAAVEEEKLARIRHIGMNYAGGLPFRAIEFCLERAGIGFDKIDCVAYYLEPHKRFHREIAFNSARAIDSAEHGSIEDFPPYFVESLNGLKQMLKTRRLVESRLSASGKFVEVPHHLAHGASAFYASGFERAAVISVDNKGDMTAAALMTGSGEQLRIHAEAQFPHSIGMVYSAVTAALGFSADGDWHKTMWLAPTGTGEFQEIFGDLLRVGADGLPVVNLDYFDPSLGGTLTLSDQFFERAGLKQRARDEPIAQKHRNLAASVQARIEDVLCEMALRHREQTGEEDLCLAGGVALNSLANSAVERRARFQEIICATGCRQCGLLYRSGAVCLASSVGQSRASL